MSSPRVSRRTLATGAAWAVPVIAVGAAAPALAASTGTAPTVSLNRYVPSGGNGNFTWTIYIDLSALVVGVVYSVRLHVVDSKGSSTTQTITFTASALTAAETFLATRHDNGNNASITSLTYEVLEPVTATGTLI